jgi:TPP-dependent pyruvate/acetoin dehydrogenase alpha subunit
VAKVEERGALSEEELRSFLRDMLLVRRFEEKVEERFRAGELPGFLHVAIGQEAVAVGVCRALDERDVFASTHRAHGHTLARGTPPNALMAELYGKVEGCSLGYGGSTPAKQHLPIEDLEQRAVAYGMESAKVDGQDVEAVYAATTRALDHARGGDGPFFLLCETYRFVGHYVGDPQIYRPKDEVQRLRETEDPIEKLRERLGLTDEEFEEVDREVTQVVEESVEFAKNGTDPPPEAALDNVYA